MRSGAACLVLLHDFLVVDAGDALERVGDDQDLGDVRLDLVLRQGPRENVAQEHVSDKLLCCAGVFVGNAPRRAVMKRFLVFSRSVASFSTSSIVWSLTSSVFVVAWKGCACARACVRERERGGAISRAESAVSVPARARRCAGEGGLREVRLAGRVGSGDGRMEERPPFSLGRVRLSDSAAIHQQDSIRVVLVVLPSGRAPVLVLLDGHLRPRGGGSDGARLPCGRRGLGAG